MTFDLSKNEGLESETAPPRAASVEELLHHIHWGSPCASILEGREASGPALLLAIAFEAAPDLQGVGPPERALSGTEPQAIAGFLIDIGT